MLVLQKVSKYYNNKPIIRNFSYVFEKGKIYSLIAPSGAGKSTLLKLISGLEKLSSGNIYFDNKNIKKLKNYSFSNVGYVYQSYQLFDNLTAYENVILPIEMIGENINKYLYKIKTLFKYFEIEHTLNIKVKNLSGGEKQRISLIRAITRKIDILLLDEPTSALDDKMAEKLFEYLNYIKENIIIIFVTHNNNLAYKADEIIDLQKYQNIKTNILYKNKIYEKKIKFQKSRYIYKKIFKNKKILTYITSSITTLGLIGIGVSFILKSFINNAAKKSFNELDNSNNITIQAKQNVIDIDFNNLDTSIDYIYYEGIENNLKNKIKENSLITYCDFNLYDIENYNFIFDNYLNINEKTLVDLAIPSGAIDYINENNYINAYYLDKKITIKINNIFLSEDDNFYLYCNNFSYLYEYFICNSIEIEKSSYLYSNSSNKLFNYLNENYIYKDYYFYLDKQNNVIMVNKINESRLTKDILDVFIKNNNIDNYILSDNIHSYIDFNTGFIYLLDKENIQIIIDNNIEEIEVSSAYYNKHNSDYIELFGTEYKINNIRNQNNVELIYINKNLFNSFNDEIYFTGLIFDKNINTINKNENITIKGNLFSINNYSVLNYISDFLTIFSSIIIIFAFISSIIVFMLNIKNKTKDAKVLIRLGVYKTNVFKLLIYEPFSNIITSCMGSTIALVIVNILIYIIYNLSSGSNIDITFNYFSYIFIFLVPIIILLPIISFMSFISIYKNN